MPTIEEIQKRFRVEEGDAKEILAIHATGVDYGKRNVALDSEEFKDIAEFDIEHTETLLDLKEGSMLRLFKTGYQEGRKQRAVEQAATAKRTRTTRKRTVTPTTAIQDAPQA